MGRVRETDDGWVSAGGGAVPAPGACQANGGSCGRASRVEGGLAGPAGPVEGSDWPPDAVRQGRSEEKKVPRLHPSSFTLQPLRPAGQTQVHVKGERVGAGWPASLGAGGRDAERRSGGTQGQWPARPLPGRVAQGLRAEA